MGRPAGSGTWPGWAGYTWIFSPAVEFGRDAPDRGYGNALLTRVPVRAVQQWRLTWPPRLYDGSEPSEPRSVILAEVPFGTGTAWIGSTHLPATDPAARACALDRLTELTAGLGRWWVICGDFNTPPATWAARRLAGSAAAQLPGQRPGRTDRLLRGLARRVRGGQHPDRGRFRSPAAAGPLPRGLNPLVTSAG